jgi:hypothetical protein
MIWPRMSKSYRSAVVSPHWDAVRQTYVVSILEKPTSRIKHLTRLRVGNIRFVRRPTLRSRRSHTIQALCWCRGLGLSQVNSIHPPGLRSRRALRNSPPGSSLHTSCRKKIRSAMLSSEGRARFRSSRIFSMFGRTCCGMKGDLSTATTCEPWFCIAKYLRAVSLCSFVADLMMHVPHRPSASARSDIHHPPRMTGRAPVKLSIVYRAPKQVTRRVSTVSIIIPFYLTHNSSEDLWAVASTGSLLKSDRALDLGKRSHHAPSTFSGTALPPSSKFRSILTERSHIRLIPSRPCPNLRAA